MCYFNFSVWSYSISPLPWWFKSFNNFKQTIPFYLLFVVFWCEFYAIQKTHLIFGPHGSLSLIGRTPIRSNTHVNLSWNYYTARENFCAWRIDWQLCCPIERWCECATCCGSCCMLHDNFKSSFGCKIIACPRQFYVVYRRLFKNLYIICISTNLRS